MGTYTRPEVLSESANYIVNNGNVMHALSEMTYDYSEVAANSMGSVSLVTGDYTLNTAPTFDGVNLQVSQQTLTPTATGQPAALVIVDTVNEDILALKIFTAKPVLVDTVDYEIAAWNIGFTNLANFYEERANLLEPGVWYTGVVAQQAIDYIATNAAEVWFVDGFSTVRATNLANQILQVTGSNVVNFLNDLLVSELEISISQITSAINTGIPDHIVIDDGVNTLYVQEGGTGLALVGQNYEVVSNVVVQHPFAGVPT